MAGTSKQLSCAVGGQVMALVWPTFQGLEITTPEGFVVAPVSDDLLLPIAQQHLLAASAQDQPEARGWSPAAAAGCSCLPRHSRRGPGGRAPGARRVLAAIGSRGAAQGCIGSRMKNSFHLRSIRR